ncbi:MAG TPA: hypothetical protein VH113_02440 [Gemmatimonadales bacterium]|jgi:hypothetical protein|nr:hypothetical protein [Gemmatimonadales bacterium]
MLTLNLNADQAALLTRILDLYFSELKKAGASRDVAPRFASEGPLLRDLLAQLAAYQHAA